MSFSIWQQQPPFTFTPTDKEQIYKVGSVWVVTDDPTKATQTAVDAVLNAPAPPADPVITQNQLAAALSAAGVTAANVNAGMAAVKATPP